ncbi:MAG: hypothetical protein ACFFCS_07575 [Candidatus Hodarchaeota archaeon]
MSCLDTYQKLKLKNKTKLLHLDQNKWIELAKVYNGKERDAKKKKILAKIEELIERGELITPINWMHVAELSKRRDDDSRNRLKDFMIHLSREYVCMPYLHNEYLKVEFFNYIRNKRGITSFIDIRNGLVGKGALKYFGKRIVSDSENVINNVKIIDENILGLKYILDNLGRERKSMLKFEEGLKKSLPRIQKGIERDEELRATKNKDYLKKLFPAKYIFQFILPKIVNYCKEWNLDEEEQIKLIFRTDSGDELSWEEFMEFFKQLPSTYTYFCLQSESTNPHIHRREINDTYDIASFSLPIPYFDAVVGERFFITRAISNKLDKLYHTKLIYKIEDLEEILE